MRRRKLVAGFAFVPSAF